MPSRRGRARDKSVRVTETLGEPLREQAEAHRASSLPQSQESAGRVRFRTAKARIDATRSQYQRRGQRRGRVLRCSELVRDAEEAAEGRPWLHVTGPAPLTELGHVNAAIRHFAVVNPRLGLLEACAKCSLGEAGLFSQCPQEFGNDLVAAAVLSLGGHLTQNPCQEA